MPEAELKGLRGFCAARFWPVTENTKTSYQTAAMVEFSGARKLTKKVNRTPYTIPGDDGDWATGSRYNYEELTFEVNELPLMVKAQLNGGNYDSETQTYHVHKDEKPILVAFGYAGLMESGNYFMAKHFACKLMEVQIDHTTDEESKTDVDRYILTLRNTFRKADGQPRDERESTDGTFDWLNSIDQIPVEGG